MKYLITLLFVLTSFCSYSQVTDEQIFTIFMDKETNLLRSVVREFQIDSLKTYLEGDYYEMYDLKGNCLCQISKSEAISIDISEFNLASGYYYLVDVKELKLIRLCPIPLTPLREEP